MLEMVLASRVGGGKGQFGKWEQVPISGNIGGIYNAPAILIPGDKLFIHGGTSGGTYPSATNQVLDLKTMTVLSGIANFTPIRYSWGHLGVYHEGTRAVYILGGVKESYGLQNRISKYNVDTNTVSEITLPTPNYLQGDYSGVLIGDEIFYYGGWPSTWRTNYFAYNVVTNSWRTLTALGLENRSHKILGVGNKIYMYSGVGRSTSTPAYMYSYNTTTGESLLENNAGPYSGGNYACIAHGTDLLYFFAVTGVLNEVHKYDTILKTWSKVNGLGTFPTYRQNPISFSYNGYWYLYGGAYSSSTRTDMWRVKLP